VKRTGSMYFFKWKKKKKIGDILSVIAYFCHPPLIYKFSLKVYIKLCIICNLKPL